jgi:hypothetical protein
MGCCRDSKPAKLLGGGLATYLSCRMTLKIGLITNTRVFDYCISVVSGRFDYVAHLLISKHEYNVYMCIFCIKRAKRGFLKNISP